MLGFLATLALVLTSSLAWSSPPADFEDSAWIDGQSRSIYGSFSIPPQDPGTVSVYIIGPVDGGHPLDELTLDPNYPYVHDHVTTRTPYGHSKVVDFLVVEPGPNATADNVHYRTVEANPDIPWIQPDDGSFVITPIRQAPFEVDLGHGFEPLISASVVEEAIEAGILRTVEVARDLTIVGWSGGVTHHSH
ncbi:MAG TPA: hypothetical protein VJR29_11220 [bacterium]|nr:hypothetical protein [bacterium]